MNDSNEHDDWMDPGLAERLLDGKDIVEADDRVIGVARVLAAAVQPPTSDPRPESFVLAAFRTAQADHMVRGGRWWSRRSRAAKVALCGAAATIAFTGVAIAAQNGTLPHLFHSGSTGPEPGSSSSAPPATTGPNSRDIPGSSPSTGVPQLSPHSASPTGHPATTPTVPRTADMRGLCEAYLKAARRDQALEPSSQARLEQAAGGPEKIAAYCAGLTGTAGDHSPSATARHASPSSPPSRLSRPTALATNGRRHN